MSGGDASLVPGDDWWGTARGGRGRVATRVGSMVPLRGAGADEAASDAGDCSLEVVGGGEAHRPAGRRPGHRGYDPPRMTAAGGASRHDARESGTIGLQDCT